MKNICKFNSIIGMLSLTFVINFFAFENKQQLSISESTEKLLEKKITETPKPVADLKTKIVPVPVVPKTGLTFKQKALYSFVTIASVTGAVCSGITFIDTLGRIYNPGDPEGRWDPAGAGARLKCQAYQGCYHPQQCLTDEEQNIVALAYTGKQVVGLLASSLTSFLANSSLTGYILQKIFYNK
jgi:hypothetical protein